MLRRGVRNDIHDVLAHLGTRSVSLLGASFSGGICGYFAARGAIELDHLVLFNPLLNYKKRFIDDKPYWHDDSIDDEAAVELATEGFVPHLPTFKLGRPLLNEIRWIQPHTVLGEITTPTRIVHGGGAGGSRGGSSSGFGAWRCQLRWNQQCPRAWWECWGGRSGRGWTGWAGGGGCPGQTRRGWQSWPGRARRSRQGQG